MKVGDDLVQMFVAGDVINYNNLTGRICDSKIERIIKESDIALCNFEAPIYGNFKKANKVGKFHFQRKETIEGLKSQGFNVLLLANNHILDYGRGALESTINEIGSNKIDYLGAGLSYDDIYRPLIKTINGVKIGLINAGEAHPGVSDYNVSNETAGYAWINHFLIDQQISKLKEECDYVVLFSHAGLEHFNIPQKEWRIRYKQLCDLGADVIIGSHPHVPQGFEYYGNSLIVYSLGNFYFDTKKYIQSMNISYSAIITFDRNMDGIGFKPVFHYQENNIVKLSDSESNKIDLKYLCDILGDRYEEMHDKMVLETYNNIIRRNIAFSVSKFPLFVSPKRTISLLIKKFKHLNVPDCRRKLLIHMIKNESYKYVLQDALDILVKEGELLNE